MLTLTTRPEHLLQTLQQYLGFHTTCKRFEPGRNLIKLPVVHSAPLKYNCRYHSTLKPSNRAAKTHLIENFI